jgi:seryl-tRNA synthetase
MVNKSIDFSSLSGYQWLEDGQSFLSGPLLQLHSTLDRLFLSWAQEIEATECLTPAFLSPQQLSKLEYFHTSAQLVKLPASEGTNGILPPTACCHLYGGLQGCKLDQPVFLTTRATCFRQEKEYLPLQRQWNFSMREIVCVGSAGEVQTFLENFRAKLADFFGSSRLPIIWQNAGDPLFSPAENDTAPPIKTEMIFQDQLAIGSLNFHRDNFGRVFHIKRHNQDAFAGCVALGLERWMYAILSAFGTDAKSWPKQLSEIATQPIINKSLDFSTANNQWYGCP